MSTQMGGAGTVPRNRGSERAHEFGQYLLREINRMDMTQGKLAALINVTPSYVSKMVRGEETRPAVEVIVALANALNVRPADVWLHVARANGADVKVDDTEPPPQTDEQLIYELSRRLRNCAPVIEPLRIVEMGDEAIPQLALLMRELRAAAQISDTEKLEYRALAQRHLADYLEELYARAERERPATDS